jgi:hypothetical protein
LKIARAWLVAQAKMTPMVKIDNDHKIIKRAVSGVLHTDRAIRVIRELSMATKTQKDYDILMDLRGSVTAPEMTDLMAIMSAW